MLKDDLMKRYQNSPGYVGKRKIAAIDYTLANNRRKGVMTKSQFKRRLLEDLKIDG